MRRWYRANYFFLKRLHSLLGIVPIGAFFLVHMLLNSRAAQSPEQYQWVPDTLDQIPFIWAIELGLIIAPILFHAILGAIIFVQSEPNAYKPALGWYANWAYLFQRYTGVALFILLVLHLAQTWYLHWRVKIFNALNPDEAREFAIFSHMNGILANPAWLTVYVIFVLIAAYHLGNGIYNFTYKWGATTSKSSQRWAIAFGLFIGFIGAWIGLASLWGLRFSPWASEMLAGAAQWLAIH